MTLNEIDLGADTLLYFVHIPKTAGTSMYAFLDRQFLPNQVFPADRASWHGPGMALMPAESINRFSCLRGHLYHNQLSPFWASCRKRLIPITVLRQPESQLLSEFDMAINDPNAPFHSEAVQRALTFEQFMREHRHFVHSADNPGWPGMTANNRQSAHLLMQQAQNPFELPTEDWLERVTSQLSDYPVVGLSERFDETLQLLAFTFGWRCPPASPRLNPMRGAKLSLTEETRAEVRALNKVDFQLYEWAVARFDRQYADMLQVLTEEDELRPESAADDVVAAINRRSARRLKSRLMQDRAGDVELVDAEGLLLGHVSPSTFRQINWIGPEPRLKLKLGLPGGRGRVLHLEFAHWLTVKMLEDLTITLNGTAVPSTHTRSGETCHVVAYLPDEMLGSPGEAVELQLKTSGVSTPAAEGLNPVDHEQKCLALSSLHCLAVEVPQLGRVEWKSH